MATKDQHLSYIQMTQHELNIAQAERDEKKQARDQAIADAVAEGVSMYAISKQTGISQTAISYIRDRNPRNA